MRNKCLSVDERLLSRRFGIEIGAVTEHVAFLNANQ